MEKLYDVVVRQNMKTGKKDIFKIQTYKDLDRREANRLISELMSNRKSRISKIKSSVQLFFDELGCSKVDIDDYFVGREVQDVFDEYKEFCIENDLVALSKIELSKILCSELSLNTYVKYFKSNDFQEAKQCRVYRKNDTK